MENELANIDFHKFVDDELHKNGFKCIQVTESFVNENLNDIMDFYNSIRLEYKDRYGWNTESAEYFLNPLTDKFKYSFAFIDELNKIHFLNFSSLYNNVIHYHFSFTLKESRGMNLAKIHSIQVSQTGLDNNLETVEGYWPKNNIGSLILHLSLGFEIQSIRNDTDLLMKASLVKLRNKAYNLILHSKKI
jgi:hypothetical protein